MSLHAILQSALKNAVITAYLVKFKLSDSNVALHRGWRGSIGKCARMPRAALQIMHESGVTHSQCSTSEARAALIGMRYDR